MSKLVFIANTTAAVSETVHYGKSYLIAPVVLIKEGVLNGYLYLAEEINKFVESWNGRPVPISHPKRTGEYVSANTPDIWALEVPGFLWNVYADNSGLKGEIWLELDRAEKIGEPATNIVDSWRAGQGMDVSTGLWFELDETPGTWNGIPYVGIARNIRPDHLALLPNEVGACSWDDGCGVPRTNQKGEGMEDEVTVNELTLDDRASLVRRAFWNSPASILDDDVWNDWDVIHVFDTTLIAKDWNKKTHMAFPYTIDEAGTVSFGTPTAVEVVYRAKDDGTEVVVANADSKPQGWFARFRRMLASGKVEGIGQLPINNGADAPVINQEENVSKCDKVAALVANERCKFSKATLDTWSESDLDTLQATLATNTLTTNSTAPLPAAPQPQAPAAVDAEAVAAKVLEAVNAKLDPILAAITANAGRERADMVAQIVANSQFVEKDLESMTLDQLQKLVSSLQTRDYSGGAGVIRGNSGDDGDYELAMPMPQAWVVAGEGK